MEFRCRCGKLLCKRNKELHYEIVVKDKSSNVAFPYGVITCGACHKRYIFQPFIPYQQEFIELKADYMKLVN